jgi:hypothetical protein
MNIVELNNAIKSVRLWLKTNNVLGIGDLHNGFQVNPSQVNFAGEINSNFVTTCDRVGVQYVSAEADCAVLGFYLDKDGIAVEYLNECISYTRYYNGNHDQDEYTGKPLFETSFMGDLVLVCSYDCDENNNQTYSYALYTTPNFKELRAIADKADEERWINELGLKTRKTRRR